VRVLLTGATGLAGSEALRQCLADPAVTAVNVLARRAPAVTDAKLSFVLCKDFLDYSAVDAALRDLDACLWCLGVSQGQVGSNEEYERVTFGYTVAAAKALLAHNPALAFSFLSGQGADSKEKSFILYARVKGRTENALFALSPRAVAFRPGYIRPVVPFSGKPWTERAYGAVVGALRPVFPSLVCDADVLGRAMIRAARSGSAARVLENNAIVAIGRAPI
jgi:uncharacterized protein YbjT (DUF2867 family)